MYIELAELTIEQKAIKEQAHRFASEVLRPASLKLDQMSPEAVIAPDSPLWDVFRAAWAQGYNVIGLPGSDGGPPDPLAGHIVGEEYGWGAVDLSVSLGVARMPFNATAAVAKLRGDTNLYDEIVRPFAEAKEPTYIGCWAVTEPRHGSDAVFQRPETPPFDCRARRDGSDWVLNGQKSAWVTNGTIATHSLMSVCVDPDRGMAGSGVAIVPLTIPGVSKGKPLDKLGQRALNQGEIFLDDVRIPGNYMLFDPSTMGSRTGGGNPNAGLAVAMTGVARAAFEEALTYCKDRVQGGVPIAEHQLVQAKLFDMFSRVEQARLFSRAVLSYNTRPGALPAYSSAAKVFCTQAAFSVASDAIQLHGGIGLTKGIVVEKLFRDARASLIEDGINEVLSLAGARQILETYVP